MQKDKKVYGTEFEGAFSRAGGELGMGRGMLWHGTHNITNDRQPYVDFSET
jgi:hypothetical protein